MTKVIHFVGSADSRLVKKRVLFSLLTFFFLFAAVRAQDLSQVTGKVLAADDTPVIGAYVTVNGEKGGAVTDADGRFTLRVEKEKYPRTLVVKYIGYKTTQIPLYSRRDTHGQIIRLEEDNYSLDDVVVVGYGTSSRKKLTGAVSKVDGSIVAQATQDAPILALQGHASGVYVTQSSGVPGGGNTSIIIRGQNTLTSQTEPLYVVDGVPFNAATQNPVGTSSTGVFGLPDALSFINPSDIESIEILKDADATAIYGTRGANGVVLITTKKGESGKVKVNASFSTSASYVQKRLDFLDTSTYLEMRRRAYESDLASGALTTDNYNTANFPDLILWDDSYTDWQDAMMGHTAMGYDAQLAISGGNRNTSFLVGGAYYTSNTVLVSDDQYTRWSARANITHHSDNNRFNMEAGLILSNIIMDSNGGSSPYGSLNTAPNTPLFDEEGRPYYVPDDPDYSSATSFLASEADNKSVNVMGNFSASYRIWRTLTAKVSLGYNHSSSDQQSLKKRYYYNPYNPEIHSEANYYMAQTTTFVVEPQLTYTVGLCGGTLSLLAGGTYQNATSKYLSFWGREYLADSFMPNVEAATQMLSNTNPYKQTKTASFFARLSYDWQSRYLLNVVYRRDGSSRFGPEHRFGNFYSVGAGWLFGNEPFVKERVGRVLSHGKLRFSYGRTGNDGIGDYAYMTKYSITSFPYAGSKGFSPDNIANENLHWETTNKMDVGLEVGLFDDRILLNAAFFYNRSYDLLGNVNVSGQTGFSSIATNLNATVENKGWELELNTQNIKTHDFRWNTNFNITIPRNKLVEYEDLENSSDYTSYEIGKSINLVRGYKYLGVNPDNGVPMFEDLDDNGRLSSRTDYQFLGTTDPSFYGGLANTLSYKNLTLDFSFYFRKKNMQVGYFRHFGTAGGRNNVTEEVYKHTWTTPGQDAKYPGLTTTSASEIGKANAYLSSSDFAYSTGSYLRLQHVTLAYDFPQDWLVPFHLNALRMYVQGKNLFTISDYDSYDPETASAVPVLTSFVFGLNVTF